MAEHVKDFNSHLLDQNQNEIQLGHLGLSVYFVVHNVCLHLGNQKQVGKCPLHHWRVFLLNE